MCSKDDEGQLATLEGLTAALILIGLLIYITQSVSAISPQTEMTTTMKLYQKTADTLICLDRLDETNSSDLKTTVEGWNGSSATDTSKIPPGDLSIQSLDGLIAGYFPPDVGYNVELYYNDGVEHDLPVIIHGRPSDNSVIASRLVTINDGDDISPYWTGVNRYPQVVEVRLISWYI